MIDFILHIITCELILVGIFASTRRGMILGFIPRYINHYFIEKYRIEARYLKRQRVKCIEEIYNLEEEANNPQVRKPHQTQPQNPQMEREILDNRKTVLTRIESKQLSIIRFREKLLYPIYYCLPCMSSFWGTIYFIIFDAGSLSQWGIFLLALCGLGWLLRSYV